MGYQGDDQRCYKVSESLYSYINEELYHRTPSFTKGGPKRNTPTCVGKASGQALPGFQQRKHPHEYGELLKKEISHPVF